MPLGLAGLGGSWLTMASYGQAPQAAGEVLLAVDTSRPAYFLPTVAGGLIASAGAAEVGQQRLAELMLGLGAVCWLVLGSIILGRLLFRPPLPNPLLPTLAIEVAPAAVASLAYFALRGDHIDTVTPSSADTVC
jgi:tellurite resistance protein